MEFKPIEEANGLNGQILIIYDDGYARVEDDPQEFDYQPYKRSAGAVTPVAFVAVKDIPGVAHVLSAMKGNRH